MFVDGWLNKFAKFIMICRLPCRLITITLTYYSRIVYHCEQYGATNLFFYSRLKKPLLLSGLRNYRTNFKNVLCSSWMKRSTKIMFASRGEYVNLFRPVYLNFRVTKFFHLVQPINMLRRFSSSRNCVCVWLLHMNS